MNNQFELATTLPEFVESGLPQISLEELDTLHNKDFKDLSTERLTQIAQSARNGADVSQHLFSEKDQEIKYIETDKEGNQKQNDEAVKKSSKEMAFLLKNGKFTVSAKNATSVVIATKVFEDVAKGKLSVGYHEYQHVLIAMAVDFQGNANTAMTLNNVFLTWGNVSIEMANNKARLSHYEMLYNQASMYIKEREYQALQEQYDKEQAELAESEGNSDAPVIFLDKGEATEEA